MAWGSCTSVTASTNCTPSRIRSPCYAMASGSRRALFGLDQAEAGTVRLQGQALALRSPRDAIQAGMAFLPEDRKAEGIIPELSVRENLTLAALPELTRLGVVSRARQREIVSQYM